MHYLLSVGVRIICARCPTCGSISVALGGHVAEVSLQGPAEFGAVVFENTSLANEVHQLTVKSLSNRTVVLDAADVFLEPSKSPVSGIN